MRIERNAAAEEDAYSYHLSEPVKCRCGAVDEYINRAKKSCHRIKRELFGLSDLLHKQQNVSNKIFEISAELNEKFDPPSFWQSVAKDAVFAGKVFLILLGAVMGVDIFLFIITTLMFFFGLAFQSPGIAENANELFYNINMFKAQGGDFLSLFGWDTKIRPLRDYGSDISETLVIGYIPGAVMGFVIIAFYVFLAVFLVRISINIAKLTLFASRVMNQRMKINQKREEYQKHLDDLGAIYQNLCDQIDEASAVPDDYKNIKAADTLLKYFINNRTDTLREAINLYHEEEYKNKMVEYAKATYNETRQTRRYTKALYIMTSDESIKVDIKEQREDTAGSENDGAQIGELLRSALSRVKKPPANLKSPKNVSQISPPPESASDSSGEEDIPNKRDTEYIDDKQEESVTVIPDMSDSGETVSEERDDSGVLPNG